MCLVMCVCSEQCVLCNACLLSSACVLSDACVLSNVCYATLGSYAMCHLCHSLAYTVLPPVLSELWEHKGVGVKPLLKTKQLLQTAPDQTATQAWQASGTPSSGA